MNGSGERQRWVEPRVHFEFGPEFLRAFIATFGIEGWNRWMSRMISEGYMPLGWSAEEVEPPVWYSFDFGKVDLPRVVLDQLDLRICDMGFEDDEESDGQPGHAEIRVPVRAVLIVE